MKDLVLSSSAGAVMFGTGIQGVSIFYIQIVTPGTGCPTILNPYIYPQGTKCCNILFTDFYTL
jgi:hypothetical protein